MENRDYRNYFGRTFSYSEGGKIKTIFIIMSGLRILTGAPTAELMFAAWESTRNFNRRDEPLTSFAKYFEIAQDEIVRALEPSVISFLGQDTNSWKLQTFAADLDNKTINVQIVHKTIEHFTVIRRIEAESEFDTVIAENPTLAHAIVGYGWQAGAELDDQLKQADPAN